MTIPPDQTDDLRKYGAIDFAPVRKARPCGRLFTDAEIEEMRRFEAEKLLAEANAVYLGRAPKPPLHPDPLVCEIAEMLLKEFDR